MPGTGDVILLQRDVAETKEKLATHISNFDHHVEVEHDRWDHLLTVTENNAKSISELTSATKDIVEVWQTGSAVVKAGSTVATFVKWIAGLGVAGTAISVGVTWVIEKLG